MAQNNNRKLVLQTGEEFYGTGFGASNRYVGEIVFNTSMVGYQEILSDPSYFGQIVVMTYPVIGQYGITDEDFETRTDSTASLIVREYCDTPSNFRFTKTLQEELEDHDAPGLSGVDTRMITRIIREKGTMMAAVVEAEMPLQEALDLIASTPALKRPVEKTTSQKRWYKRTAQHKYDVVVVDCGVKLSMLECLTARGCNVTVVPFNTSAEEILRFNPDGVMISAGPGDPRELQDIVGLINGIKGKVPMFGTSLGHELIAMSYGATIGTLKAGHHGGRPVRNLEDGRISPVEHNHKFIVDKESLSGTPLKITYVDIVDGCVEGLVCEEDKVVTTQFYSQGGPGPVEPAALEKFIGWMGK